jgi:two-component system nitrate/nitrite response regulator NarL
MSPYPAIIIHPSRLFCEALGIVLRNALFKLVLVARDIDSVPFGSVCQTAVFIIAGLTHGHTVGLVRKIRRRLPSAIIVVIGDANKPEAVMMAVEAGADGYLCEDITSETLIMALKLIIRGETVLPAAVARCLPRYFTPPTEATLGNSVHCEEIPVSLQGENDLSGGQLSARQASILQALADGTPNKVIAKNLHISEATVKLHVKAVLQKIHVKNRTQAAVWAVKNPRRRPQN